MFNFFKKKLKKFKLTAQRIDYFKQKLIKTKNDDLEDDVTHFNLFQHLECEGCFICKSQPSYLAKIRIEGFDDFPTDDVLYRHAFAQALKEYLKQFELFGGNEKKKCRMYMKKSKQVCLQFSQRDILLYVYGYDMDFLKSKIEALREDKLFRVCIFEFMIST